MQTRLTLQPGQRGTKKLVTQYGTYLVCVRYRYDAQQHKRFKTVELIVDESPWVPPTAPTVSASPVYIRVAVAEVTLRQQIKQAGGQWDSQRRLWVLPYAQVVALGLEQRVVTREHLSM
ncbi:MAG: hypothetical protein AB7G75_25920 [Candidatus Binatia bacterium]